ncbi:hypothetical protein BKA66DRAFT_574110 [Pyrenochaeta sp. MPI-SDFR-AT-0127]|nr:hypothetical protein BKA66DRAFT_574110 [Pyrenochaeta sp. MPI-SDFR-AT-0127]
MARTVKRVTLEPSRTDERPTRVPSTTPRFFADLGLIYAEQLDDDAVILAPANYDEEFDVRWREESNGGRCWKATVIYEQLDQHHPHIVPFLRRDPWTAFPVLAKPSGPPVTEFIRQHKTTMYSAPLDTESSRILPLYRPLIYQWALHLVSGLSFVHAHNIVWGDLNLAHCWLSADAQLSLSLAGFVNAAFSTYPGDWTFGEAFHPCEHQRDPTKHTDLFLYGCVVYELMTGNWPGNSLTGRSWRDIAMMIPRRQWPALEVVHMGQIVRKCWAGEFENIDQLKADVVAFLEDLDWVIERDDNLRGLDFANLLSD